MIVTYRIDFKNVMLHLKIEKKKRLVETWGAERRLKSRTAVHLVVVVRARKRRRFQE